MTKFNKIRIGSTIIYTNDSTKTIYTCLGINPVGYYIFACKARRIYPNISPYDVGREAYDNYINGGYTDWFPMIPENTSEDDFYFVDVEVENMKSKVKDPIMRIAKESSVDLKKLRADWSKFNYQSDWED